MHNRIRSLIGGTKRFNMKKIDSVKTETVIGVLNDLEKTAEKVRDRKDARRFREISLPLTLHEGLKRLTKDELHYIRKRLDIKKASGLKKGELIALLEKKIPEHIEQTCRILDDTRYEMLKKMATQNGVISLPETEPQQLEYWLSSGIMFSGEVEGTRVLVMPEDILQQFSQIATGELDETTKRNTEWIKLTGGMLYYYGSLTVSQILDFLENNYLGAEPEHFKYFSVVYDAADYYKNIRFEADTWSNIRVVDSQKVIEEHQKRNDLSFYPFGKEQLLQAGEVGYIDKDRSYLQLVHFLSNNFTIKKEKAESLAEECMYAIKSGESPVNILTFLQKYVEFSNMETLRKLTEKVIHLMNHTRGWFLKGHRSIDLMKDEKKGLKPLPVKKKKIGRNEPCPCGSTRKYKKCCGR